MLVLDALFDHFQQKSSHVEIIGSLVRRSPVSASDVRAGVNRVVLTADGLLAIRPDKQTCQAATGMSQVGGQPSEITARFRETLH